MNKIITKSCLVALLAIKAFSNTAFAQVPVPFTMQREKNGILLFSGSQKLRIEFIDPAVVRVRYVPEGEFKDNGTDVCVATKTKAIPFFAEQRKDHLRLQSSTLIVSISKNSGSISYYDRAGKLLLSENPVTPRKTERVNLSKTTFNDQESKVVKTANGDQVAANISERSMVGTAWKARQQFLWQNGEALYGLGAHEEDYMNLRGKRQYLYEYNLKKSIPVLLSSRGYGLLFDAGSAMTFHDDQEGSFVDMMAVNQIDYYFIYGPEFDGIVHRFRSLTGKVELPPRYMFGYIQSQERYEDQQEIDSVVQRFRFSRIPLDLIVQDWQYWKGDNWGFKKFDETRYPAPARMIDKVHQQNVHFMLSVWPQLAANEETEMKAAGYVLGRRIYDAFKPEARRMYWNDYVEKNLFSKGVDAWWLDCSEPIEFDWNKNANDIANDPATRFEKNVKVMADLLGEMRVNTFSLNHTKGVYENQRKSGSSKRVVILTRTSYPGQQRYGTMVWNGDVSASWKAFKTWIPSGLNYMATGAPYWTIDAGAFFVKPGAEWFRNGEFPNTTADSGYREFYVRNLQYAGWLPIFRSHGTDCKREPWQFGAKGGMFYDAIIKQIALRYRLLPFIYSEAAQVTNQDRTITRPLIFDFRKDTSVYDIKDQFLFGSAFLICPVTDPMYYKPGNDVLKDISKTRSVYLPAETDWVDFWTGKTMPGGKPIIAETPIDHIPVFVKAGSIVPLGPIKQYADESPGSALEIRIYPGKNGKFTVYEDEGDTYNYQTGKSAVFDISWNDQSKTVTISKRYGYYPGLVTHRLLNLVLVKEGYGTGLTQYNGVTMDYTGKLISKKLIN